MERYTKEIFALTADRVEGMILIPSTNILTLLIVSRYSNARTLNNGVVEGLHRKIHERPRYQLLNILDISNTRHEKRPGLGNYRYAIKTCQL